jgi:alkylation response protein AidB-like acyl-CoA dehydrogenase
MDFALTEEQQALADTLRDLLARHAAEDALWTRLIEVGVPALAVPEEHEGVGASLFETAIALEEVGRSLATTPLLGTAIATAALLLDGTDEQRSSLLPRIAAGATATVVVEAPLVLDPEAEIVLVPRHDGLVEASERPEPRPALDPALRLGHLGVEAEPSRALRDVAAALTTAVQLGVARRGLDMTVAYTKERVQFGRPIGSFQALKHRMADLHVLVEMSRSASWAATAAAAAQLAGSESDLHLRATVAKAYCSDALSRVAAETVQLHGGIAITWEHEAHLVLKRAHALAQLFGTTREHRAAVDL